MIVKLKNGTVGKIFLDVNHDITCPDDVIGKRVGVELTDENGLPIEDYGTVEEILES
jgi:hypothetical protein